MFCWRFFFPQVASLSPATSHHSTVSLKTLVSKSNCLKLPRKPQSRLSVKRSVPCKCPLAGIPSPKWAVLGPPRVVPVTACPSSSHSLLPDHAAQSAAVRMCRPEGLVLPAKGRFPQIPALWSIVEEMSGNWAAPALLHTGHLCVLVCVCFSVSGCSFTNTCSQSHFKKCQSLLWL